MLEYLQRRINQEIGDEVKVRVCDPKNYYTFYKEVENGFYLNSVKAISFLTKISDISMEEYLKNSVRVILGKEIQPNEINRIRTLFPKRFWEIIFDICRDNPKVELERLRKQSL